MTYFRKPDHSYHRAIFEFTNTEIKATGIKPEAIRTTKLEMIQLLQRIAENYDKDKV